MGHVVTRPREPFLALDGAARIHQVPDRVDNLIWLLECTATGDTAIVDGPSAAPAIAYAEANGLTITAIWNTHTHGDHVGVNKDWVAKGLPDGFRIFGPAGAADDVPGLTDPVDEGDEAQVGQLTARVWRTDGHILGHVCFLLGDVLFCGDTLFAGGCGFVFTGRMDQMFTSLMRLAELDPETRVCCAHEYTEDNLRFALYLEPGNPDLQQRWEAVQAIRQEGGCTVPSTMGEEQATNPFLRPGSPELRQRLAELVPDQPLDSDEAVFVATRELKNTGRHKGEA